MGSNGPKSDGLVRQGSLYNLTLDEVQHQLGDLGKPLASMNLDELLKSVWTAEGEYGQNAQPATGSSLGRESSINNLSLDLRKRTVDEVWQDIQQDHKKKDSVTSGENDKKKDDKKRQTTLCEMTLEDFLVKAGVVTGSKNVESNRQNMNPQLPQWMQYQVAPVPQQHVYMTGHHPAQQSLSIVPTPMMEVGYPETQMTMSPSHLMHNLSSDTQSPGRKRSASGNVMERTVERRQKRMIKNRESAARSRARKQAYTHELENKISHLKEENERLKRQKEVGTVFPSSPPPKPKYQLRRTTSAPF